MIPLTTDTDPESSLQMAATLGEVQALSEYLQSRVLTLSIEVRRRDARIAELETELSATQEDVSGTSEEPRRQ